MDVPDLGIAFQSAPKNSPVKKASAEKPKPYIVLTPTAAQSLQQKLAGSCKILSRPQARGFLDKPTEMHLAQTGPPGTENYSMEIKMLARFSKAPGALDLKIDGKNRGQSTHIDATVPLGQTLVVNLGTHFMNAASVNKVPVLGDLPLISRYFRNVAVAREKRQTLVFITPEFVK